MTEAEIRKLLEAVRRGKLKPRAAVERLRRLPFEDLGYAKIDHHRSLRQGYAEVIYAPGKRPEQ
ncbi:MAG: 1-(5-phosphoribosyl)-5-amino-4-imidazole-carboxylate carboxylase, partial [Terriglobia bacterium]